MLMWGQPPSAVRRAKLDWFLLHNRQRRRTISKQALAADPKAREKSADLAKPDLSTEREMAAAPAVVARPRWFPSYRAVCNPRIRAAPLLPPRSACRSSRAGNEPRCRPDSPPPPSDKRPALPEKLHAQNTNCPVADRPSRA